MVVLPELGGVLSDPGCALPEFLREKTPVGNHYGHHGTDVGMAHGWSTRNTSNHHYISLTADLGLLPNQHTTQNKNRKSSAQIMAIFHFASRCPMQTLRIRLCVHISNSTAHVSFHFTHTDAPYISNIMFNFSHELKGTMLNNLWL